VDSAQVIRRKIARGSLCHKKGIASFAPYNELSALLVQITCPLVKCGKLLSGLLGMEQALHVISHIGLYGADG
jgi:hypothetical protein